MNVMVSARVPVELRDQAARRMEQDGVTTTQLINAAYQEYARTGRLPGESGASAQSAREGKRKLTRQQRAQLEKSVRASTLDIPTGRIPDDYKSVLLEGKQADYEALA